MAKPSQLFVFFTQSLSITYALRTIIYSLLFLLVAAVLINIVNIFSILGSDYSLPSKLNLVLIFIIGAFSVISQRDIFFLILIAILFGANLELVLEKIRFLKKQHNLELTFGSGIISIAVAGCASCGLSIVSFIGLGGVLAALPFGGVELYVLSVVILLINYLYNLNALYKACVVK